MPRMQNSQAAQAVEVTIPGSLVVLTWPAPSAMHMTQWPRSSSTFSTYAKRPLGPFSAKGTSGMRHASTTPAKASPV